MQEIWTNKLISYYNSIFQLLQILLAAKHHSQNFCCFFLSPETETPNCALVWKPQLPQRVALVLELILMLLALQITIIFYHISPLIPALPFPRYPIQWQFSSKLHNRHNLNFCVFAVKLFLVMLATWQCWPNRIIYLSVAHTHLDIHYSSLTSFCYRSWLHSFCKQKQS